MRAPEPAAREAEARVGVAGWSIPSGIADRFDAGGSQLERYASRFDAVEINSSFHRPHRRSTYERWADSVPADFRFAVKLPKTITHERRLLACADLMTQFAEAVDGRGTKRGPVLVQLPPSFAYDGALAEDFFTELAAIVGGPFVCEPRNLSFFSDGADALLRRLGVARVAADPSSFAGGSEPGGFPQLAYFRWHGSPRIYWSPYADPAIDALAHAVRALRTRGAVVWTIFDNTAASAAPADALSLVGKLAPAASSEGR